MLAARLFAAMRAPSFSLRENTLQNIGQDRPLRILIAHNRYQQAGGEDTVFASESRLLREAGYDVMCLEISNDLIGAQIGRASAALSATYSRRGVTLVTDAIAAFEPDILHVHNFFPLLSPAIFAVARGKGVATVLTLHNFRLACPQGTLFRDGAHCDLCVGKIPWRAVRHRCYQNSTSGSVAVAASLVAHRALGTWRGNVSRFIVLSDYARRVAIGSGVPAERIAIKPNFAPPATGIVAGRSGALYLGRLSSEKGARVLVEAWRSLPQIDLTVMGDGPERAVLERLAPPHVHFVGKQPRSEAMAALGRAQALILPSTCFENFSLSLCEAMAHGTPVIASAFGAHAELIQHGVNGLLVSPGDAGALAAAVTAAFADAAGLAVLGKAGAETWARHLSPSANLELLLAVYRAAMSEG